jgi:hypothetical protein
MRPQRWSCRGAVLIALAVSMHQGGLSAAATYHYEPVPGKLMGIWPGNWSLERLLQLRYRFGFSHVGIFPQTYNYENAIGAGFAPNNIMVGLWDLHTSVDSFPAAMYYTDEPVEHDCFGGSGGTPLLNPEVLLELGSYIHQARPGSMFVMSGYKLCSHNRIALGYCDAFMYSAYQSWNQVSWFRCNVNLGWGDASEYAWIPGSDDQSASWTATRSAYGAKFFMTWVNGASDEYSQLFATANNLGLTGIWQYNPPDAPLDTAHMESYCYAAWQNGWLTRVKDAPVPVQLASFTGRIDYRGNVLLEWVTLSQVNNYGFEVERRSVMDKSYTSVHGGFVPGNGTTLTPHKYSFLDSTVGPGTWIYRLKQIDLDGSFRYGPEATVAQVTTVHDHGHASSFALAQNYPNPFNPATIIEYELPMDNWVSLRVYDVLGREVAMLVNGFTPAGRHSVAFDGSGLPSGVYYYRLESVAQPGAGSGAFVTTRKLVLLR